MTLIPIRLPKVKIGADLSETVLDSLNRKAIRLRNGDVVAVASKVVSTCEGRTRGLNQVRITRLARRVARRWWIDERLVAIVLEERARILGGVRGFLLTIKDGILTANAGVDLKNSFPENAMLWPKNADLSAKRLKVSLERRHGARVGVMVVDSRITPMRLGTVGLAIGTSGFVPVNDHRGNTDLYGRKVQVTQTSVADDLASAVHLLMGESDEQIGVVVVRNAPIQVRDGEGSRSARMSASKCLVTSNIPKATKFKPR